MNNKLNAWKSSFLFGLRSLVLVKVLLWASPVRAQSKLGRIRNEVRQQPKVETEERNDRKRPSSQERNHQQDHDRDRRVNQRNDRRRPAVNHGRRSRRPRRNFGCGQVDFFAIPAPTQFVHTREIHVIEPRPVFVPTVQPTPAPSLISEPVIVEDTPIFEDPVIVESIPDEIFVSQFENWGARVTGWYGGGVDDISQGSLAFLFQDPNALGIDGSVRTVREKGFSDHLWLGDLNLVFEPVCNDVFRLRIGAGFNWLADSWGSDFGFNLTSGFDAKLTERWILGGEIDLGNLGHSDFLHAQLSLGYRIENVELVAGFDHTNIGDVNLDSPFAGLRFRF